MHETLHDAAGSSWVCKWAWHCCTRHSDGRCAHCPGRACLQGGSVRALRGAGLSTLSAALLGKPLDKSMQMSGEEHRVGRGMQPRLSTAEL